MLNEVYDLFIDLDATEEQLEFPVLYAIGRDAVAMRELDAPRVDLSPLFETILEVVPGPSYDPEEPFQMLVSDLDYSEYLGRLAVGRSLHGTVRSNEAMVCVNEAGVPVPLRVTRLQAYEGLRLVDITEAMPGDIVIIAGMDDVAICTELGRFMLAPYGHLVTRVLHMKHIYKDYVGVDACASNLMRPAIYGAYHHITVMGKEDQPCDHKYDVTGSLCENSDKFAVDRMLPEVEIGDLLVIHDTGAHGHAMGYQYNGRLRSAEVLLQEDGSTRLIRRAETPEDYFATAVWD